ncbi:FAD-dependent oxidoreductase [Streptomyces sp. NPDC052095]|uniref:FAD-dependent oxidoreductase n=1 Tax=unclassified Streptomyces TaxID=2593676 RepID=UPI00344DDCCB
MPSPRPAFDTDLLVVGGGPAGCAAARTAASVGMRSVLIEPDALCRNLYRIPALDNVLGGHTDGISLATAITDELLTGTPLCRTALGSRVTELHAYDDHAAATLDDGRRLTAPYAVVATGVGPVQPDDTPWITVAPPETPPLSPLWRAEAEDAEGRTLLVLGGDRPIGTFLRAHPRTRTRLLVAYPASDDYKVEELRDDPRVTLHPVTHLALLLPATAETRDRDGNRHRLTADATYLSIGSAPAPPPGDLRPAPTGYCPPAAQHPRLIVAGDLRSARYQRIQTALGSGAEAALRAYYATRDVPPPDHQVPMR